MNGMMYRTEAIKFIKLSRKKFLELDIPFIKIDNEYNSKMNAYLYDREVLKEMKRNLAKQKDLEAGI